MHETAQSIKAMNPLWKKTEQKRGQKMIIKYGKFDMKHCTCTYIYRMKNAHEILKNEH
jgi:hypothetical protein